MTRTTTRAARPRLPPRIAGGYLARIGHEPIDASDVATLASLQDAHVRAVPFENLDIHLGRPLSLGLDDLAAKVVEERRGGFCYELNGLFCALLTTLGFDAWLVEARTREEDGTLGPRFDHARIVVATDEGPVLVDVGTGASPRGPIRLDRDGPQRVGHVTYRVRTRQGRFETDRLDGDDWTPGWSFDLAERRLGDFADRCLFHQRSPDSHFTSKPLCTLVTEDGHITLTDRRLIETVGGRRTEREVEEPLDVLASRFGIMLPRWPGW